ncbi:hypothetical protein [Deinococcus sp.]|uniref:hypothetical protein n=1 Tax=Deinococcus sp. TaxID=47478 RepID=UPI003C7D4CF3
MTRPVRSVLPARPSGLALLASAALLLSGCTQSFAGSASALPASLSIGTTAPEDLAVYGTSAYVSNSADGSVVRLDLSRGGAVSPFLPAATDAYSSAWGLRVVPGKNWLLSVQNQPYDFNPAHARAGRVAAFDLSTGTRINTWTLPDGMVGNSVDVDGAGNIYVGDIGPRPRIVKINPATGEVTTWATSPQWVDGGFGLGGMVYAGSGLYVSHNNALWYVAFRADGSAAAPVAVKIAGDPVIFADGMTLADGGLIYAENDVLVAGSHGTVYGVQFTGPTTATRTTLQENLADPSGVALASVGGTSYLLVDESQLGFTFGVDKGQPSRPYQVKVFAR